MSTATPTREEWLAERPTIIGASESAGILHEHPQLCEVGIWGDKTGLAEPDDLSKNERAVWGLRLERPIAEAFAEETGKAVAMWPQYTIKRHPEYPWMGATPDAMIDDGTNLEIKTADASLAGQWRDEPPIHYQIQVQHQMAVLEAEASIIVVLIGGNRLRWFDVERNDRFIDAMIARLEAFWQLVQSKTMPPVDGSLATAKVLAKLHPKDNGAVVDLRDDQGQTLWHEQLAASKTVIKAAEAAEQEAKNHIRAAMGDSTYAMLPGDVTYSLKTQTKKEHLVKESTFRVLRSVKSLPKTHGAIVAPATKSIGGNHEHDAGSGPEGSTRHVKRLAHVQGGDGANRDGVAEAPDA